MKYTTLRDLIVTGLLFGALADVSGMITSDNTVEGGNSSSSLSLSQVDSDDNLPWENRFDHLFSKEFLSSEACKIINDSDDDRDVGDALPKGEWTKQAKVEILQFLKQTTSVSGIPTEINEDDPDPIKHFYSVYVLNRLGRSQKDARSKYVVSTYTYPTCYGIEVNGKMVFAGPKDIATVRAHILVQDKTFLEAVDNEVRRLRKTIM